METIVKETTNVLLKLPEKLNEKLQRLAKSENRSRHAQIIFILESFFNGIPTNEKTNGSK